MDFRDGANYWAETAVWIELAKLFELLRGVIMDFPTGVNYWAEAADWWGRLAQSHQWLILIGARPAVMRDRLARALLIRRRIVETYLMPWADGSRYEP